MVSSEIVTMHLEDETYWSDALSEETTLSEESWDPYDCSMVELSQDIFNDIQEYLNYQRPDILKTLSITDLEEFCSSVLANALWKPRVPNNTAFYQSQHDEQKCTIREQKVCPEKWIDISSRELNDIYSLFTKYGLYPSKQDFETFVLNHSSHTSYIRV